MRIQRTIRSAVTLSLLTWFVPFGAVPADEGAIDTIEKFAWSEDAAWVNFRPYHGGVTVDDDYLSGYAWSETVGWIKLGADEETAPGATGPYTNSSATDWGVNRAPSGDLSGYAWSENAGWINFDPMDGQVTISPITGEFDGYAWSETVGWIHFRNASIPYGVKFNPGAAYCRLTLEDTGSTLLHFPEPFVVATGLESELSSDQNYSRASCLGFFATDPGTDPSLDPSPGETRYYLARGTDRCFGYGDSSLFSDPRDGLDAADPCP